MTHSGGQFRGNQRFTIRRRLGAGGMGEVYEAYDRESRQTVALKTLIRADGAAIYRFKREFRALAEVAHPNLVSLYELMAEGDCWFFTMELVEGVNFLEHTRGGSHTTQEPGTLEGLSTERHFCDSSELTKTRINDLGDEDQALAAPSLGSTLHRRQDLLRPALRQLAEGVHALHEMGTLHRDLKPSNVLVTAQGRVVILDFGLITTLLPEGRADSLVVAGTPAYMSPEQAVGKRLSEASDWYGVGVMLYEALTGQLPFTGRTRAVLDDKQRFEPPAPSELVGEVPEDLDTLCRDLLRRDPLLRPPGRAVLDRLGRDPAAAGGPHPIARPAARHVRFVGRDHDLAALNDALLASREGRTVAVFVHGPSGIGKTALVRHFLDELELRERALVLAGRCFERESVPYKALDGVVDNLSRYLLSLPRSKADALMPRDVLTLSRLFPVMLSVDSVVDAPHRELAILDPQELRRRAFASLVELLARIADRRPLVLHIDDLQWADADSLAFLDDLLRPPDPAPLLLITCFRREEIDSKPFLAALLGRSGSNRRGLSLDSLTSEEARELAWSLMPLDNSGGQPFVESVVREAGGSPFLVEQLARHAQTGEGTTTSGVTVAQMLEAQMGSLPPGARPLLETLAVAGRPVDAGLIHRAAGLEGDERPLLATLRAVHLVRASGSARQIEPYHDRIRETLTSLLDSDVVQRIHRRLVETFVASGFDDPEALCEHCLAAGDRERAATYAAIAAGKASAALAFDRAALLYRRALELSPPASCDLLELKTRLGEALVNAGRSAEAAQVYLEAASNQNPARRLDFQRRAAEQLLISGHIDEGLEVTRSVLAAFGMKLPSTPRQALLSMLLQRARLSLRGLGFVERRHDEIPEEDLRRIDICWAVAVGQSLGDVILAAEFQTRHLLLALRAGDPYRIALALAMEAGFSAIRGGPGRARAALFCGKAEELARRVDQPHAVGLSTLMTGIAAFCFGEWRRGTELCAQAEGILREQCTGVVWELTSAQTFLLAGLMFLGEIREVSERLPGLLTAASERGNLCAATELRTRSNLVWLAADDPAEAHREVTEGMRRWSQRGFYRQHHNALLALTQISLYTGDGAAAWQQISGAWPALARSLLLRVQIIRVEATHLRARSALAAATAAADPEPWFKIAESLARRIERERMPWCDPLALLLRAAVASGRRDDSRAAGLLSVASEGFARAEMGLYAAAARRRLGLTQGGPQGRQIVAEADTWMRGQEIKRPDLMTRLLAPGFRGEGVA